MIRLFVAIDFPKETKRQFADLVEQLEEEGYPLTFEKEENFHLTLKFLGWCQEKKIAEIGETIKKATIGVKPFWFRPLKIGYFLKESLILWVGVEAQEGLIKLVNQLESEFARLGFEKEKRPFTSHITFAKRRHATPPAKWKRIAEEIKEKYKDKKFSQFRVDEIVLMESNLTPQGSIYTPLLTFSLKS